MTATVESPILRLNQICMSRWIWELRWLSRWRCSVTDWKQECMEFHVDTISNEINVNLYFSSLIEALVSVDGFLRFIVRQRWRRRQRRRNSNNKLNKSSYIYIYISVVCISSLVRQQTFRRPHMFLLIETPVRHFVCRRAIGCFFLSQFVFRLTTTAFLASKQNSQNNMIWNAEYSSIIIESTHHSMPYNQQYYACAYANPR